MSTRPHPEPGGAPSDPRRGAAPGSETAGAGAPAAGSGRAEEPAREVSGRASGAASKAGSKAGSKQTGKRRGKEDGTPHDWTLFRVVIALYGALIVAYGVWQITAGTGSLPGDAEPSGPTVASSYAGLAAVLCGVGASLIAIAVKFKWANMLSFVCFAIFLGGVGRILAWAFFGLPHWSMILLMVLDLVIPPCLLVWYGWIRKANSIRREMAPGRTPAGGTGRG